MDQQDPQDQVGEQVIKDKKVLQAVLDQLEVQAQQDRQVQRDQQGLQEIKDKKGQ